MSNATHIAQTKTKHTHTWNSHYTIKLMEWYANKREFMSCLSVFWEQTNCARTEIELRSLNVLLERRPQPSTHLPTPCWFSSSDFLYACCNKSADVEWKCHIVNPPESPKSTQLWNVKYLCVCDIPFISIIPVTTAHLNKSQSCAGRDIFNFGDKNTASCHAHPIWL